jgi:hypothetical protein
LPPATVLVEFEKFNEWDWKRNVWGASQYVAFVVPPTQEIQLVDLVNVDSLERIIKETLATLRQGGLARDSKGAAAGGARLTRHLWQTADCGDR